MKIQVQALKAAPISAVAVRPNSKLHAVVASNGSAHPFIGPVACTMFFEQGEMHPSNLNSFGPSDAPGRPYIWGPSTVLLWPDGSVKRAQVKTAFFLQPNELGYVTFETGKTPLPNFIWHPDLQAKVINNDIVSNTILRLNYNGQQAFCHPFLGQPKFMRSDASTLHIRFRSHFMAGTPAARIPLSLTAYVELECLSPIIKVTFVLGNDTLESPVNGGMNITNFNLTSSIPFAEFQGQAYGSKNFPLADGQTMAIRYIFSAATDAGNISNMNALSQCLITGFDYYPTVQESKAVSLAPLPPTRVTIPQIPAAYAQANNSVNFPNGEPYHHLGHINQNPPSTGAQPDFASTMPTDLQKACMGYSTKMLSRVYLSCLRESFRPSFYWETKNGVEERCQAVDYPELFFWSGRIHFANAWNTAYPTWTARNTALNNPGNFSGWGGSDNQHLSNNHLRYLYQMTLDPYLEDVLKYYLSLDNWNFFNQHWIGAIESERSARTTKDALELCELFPNDPNAVLLRPRVNVKMNAYNADVTDKKTRFSISAIAPFDACDARVMGGRNCSIQQQTGKGNIVAVAWQSGFHLELQAMTTNIPGYLDDALIYFFQSTPQGTTIQPGQPKTYFLLTDPNNYDVGGIGITWWSGWVIYALRNPQHPNSAFIVNTVKPLIEAAMPVVGFWSHEDGWRAW